MDQDMIRKRLDQINKNNEELKEKYQAKCDEANVSKN